MQKTIRPGFLFGGNAEIEEKRKATIGIDRTPQPFFIRHLIGEKIIFYVGGCNEDGGRISQEYFNAVVNIFLDYFDGFTIGQAYGAMDGKTEHNLIITVIKDAVQEETINAACAHIKRVLHQESVLYERLPTSATFV